MNNYCKQICELLKELGYEIPVRGEAEFIWSYKVYKALLDIKRRLQESEKGNEGKTP